jgi:hypothetical protein
MPDETMEEAAAPEPIVFGTLEKTAEQADGVALGVSRGNINKADDSQHMALTAVRARATRVICWCTGLVRLRAGDAARTVEQGDVARRPAAFVWSD